MVAAQMRVYREAILSARTDNGAENASFLASKKGGNPAHHNGATASS